MASSGKNKRKASSKMHRSISGYWTWNIVEDKVYGDKNLEEYFGVDVVGASAGISVSNILNAIDPRDRSRVAASIDRTVSFNSDFRETYGIRTVSQGLRKILAVGNCHYDRDGKPSFCSGWFVDVTHGEISRLTALRMASHLLAQAGEAIALVENDFLKFLLGNLIEECALALDKETNGDGRLHPEGS